MRLQMSVTIARLGKAFVAPFDGTGKWPFPGMDSHMRLEIGTKTKLLPTFRAHKRLGTSVHLFMPRQFAYVVKSLVTNATNHCFGLMQDEVLSELSRCPELPSASIHLTHKQTIRIRCIAVNSLVHSGLLGTGKGFRASIPSTI
jgi:hypothetical protein